MKNFLVNRTLSGIAFYANKLIIIYDLADSF